MKETFEEQHPGSTLTIEEQEWDGLVERLTTALSSEDQTPDVVEVGNTQAPTFTTVGAFSDLTDDLDQLGGDDLLPGFVEGATVDGRTYAVPYYAGSTYVFYRKDLFQKAGIDGVPTTMDEFVETAIELKRASDDEAFSGYWLPGQDWRDGAAFLWDAGGDFAVEEGDGWAGALGTPESIAGLERVQQVFEEASGAPADANEADPVTPFCAGQIGMMSRPGWVHGMLTDPEAGCPELAEQVGVFALPGSDGEPAPVLLGGSDIAVPAKSPPPGPRPRGGRADAQRRLPGHPRRGRPHAGQGVAHVVARRRRVRPRDHRGGVQRQAHAGRPELGSRRGRADPRGPVQPDRPGRRRRAARGRRRRADRRSPELMRAAAPDRDDAGTRPGAAVAPAPGRPRRTRRKEATGGAQGPRASYDAPAGPRPAVGGPARAGPGLPAAAPGGAVAAGVRAGAAVRAAADLGRRGQLPRARHRPLPVAGRAPARSRSASSTPG
nr:extracellular solute-binding protein [Nocardioides sp. TF02-7]